MRISHEEAQTLTAPLEQPILQFGTSRFLQAHVDLFVSQALESDESGAAIGGITVVQTTESADSAMRIGALSNDGVYPVRIRGLQAGEIVDETLTGRALRQAVHVREDWARIRAAVSGPVQIIVSNTGDRGYQLDGRDNVRDLADPALVPHSFPARLLALLHARWQSRPDVPLSLFPCELIERNGDVLRGIVVELASQWGLPGDFIRYLAEHCVWANSLVDRIVSESIRPVGAVAEPYALWAIERQPRLQVPCVHPSIVLTDNLQHFERLKLFLLNLGHTFLAERWLRDARPADETVYSAMNDTVLRTELEAVWSEEVIPVFDALGERDDALAYVGQLRERLLNPFLDHRLADIAQNHAEKKQRRISSLLALTASLMPARGMRIEQPRLTGMLAGRIWGD
ncbi:mannitol dehydrogenase family protein [Paraburkholderia sp. RP-4-7]|uniref:Mannitol dehydrogenase family protein n=1 Tax=Paraburkholderia polaris TaxID=2728848 RepID=A0A848IWP5_9BURK|nr:mannitol dehydrogenase family protein [Paraburkholderia polaris]NMM04274.1 mannitol dehydrogenase family protein [Paraburkholderia polaris]